MARGSKFRIEEVEGLFYPCSENKDADQLRGYREADLRLCFRICKNTVFSRRGSYRSYCKDPKFSDKHAEANSADPDQTAPRGAVWSGSSLFAIPFAPFWGIAPW